MLQAALKGGANLVQALAAHAGEGLGKVAQKVDQQMVVQQEVEDMEEQRLKKSIKETEKTQVQVSL